MLQHQLVVVNQISVTIQVPIQPEILISRANKHMVLGVAATNTFTTKVIITSPKIFCVSRVRLKIHLNCRYHMTNNLKF